MNSFEISNKLKVFISSAQRNENGFLWLDTRKRIKECLKQVDILNPFIIEDIGSTLPSNQVYQCEVEDSDLVVLLVKEEVRPGTITEFELCKNKNIPLLAYFLKNLPDDSEAARLQREIIAGDLCTFHNVDSFDHIEEIVKSDILNDIVRRIKWGHAKNLDQEYDIVQLSIEPTYTSRGIPGKSSLEYFDSCYDYLCSRLNISKCYKEKSTTNSKFHNLGVALINWLLYGETKISDDEISKLIDEVRDIYQNIECITNRWNAIFCELNGNSNDALKNEYQALEIAQKENSPKWVVNNILIDCRNIEAEIESQNHNFPISRDAQSELDKSETVVCLPSTDRYLNQIHQEIAKEEFAIAASSSQSLRFSNRLEIAILELANYFFSSVLYGSYTHIVCSRKILSYILQKFGTLFHSSKILFESLKLQLLNESSKDFLTFVKTYWENLYTDVVTNSDLLWQLSKKSIASNRDSMKLAVIQVVGLYFTNATFTEAEIYLLGFSDKVYWGNSEDYFKCIQKNIMRLDQNRLVCVLCEIISNQRFHLGNTISHIIMTINYDNVSEENKIKLNFVLKDNLSFIIENGGEPMLVSVLVRSNSEIFDDLVTVPGNGLIGSFLKYHEAIVGKSKWSSILNDEISSAIEQFEHCKTKGEYIQYGCSPYDMICDIIGKCPDSENTYITKLILEKFFPFASEVLCGDVSSLIKDKCAQSLIYVIPFIKQNNNSIPDSLIKSIRNSKSGDLRTLSIIGFKDWFKIRLFVLKLMVGLENSSGLFNFYEDFNNMSVDEKRAFAESLGNCLNQHGEIDIDFTLFSMIVKFIEDDDYLVRALGCKCGSGVLNYGIDNKFKILIEQKIIGCAMDSSDYVRSSILSLCESKTIPKNLYNTFVNILKNDANYAIKNRALQLE